MPPQEPAIAKSSMRDASSSNSIAADLRAQREHTPATVLLISPFAEDHNFFSSIFELPDWKAHHARGYREALKWLMRDRIAVIICESHLPDGDWKDILSQAQVLPEPPRLVVASWLASDSLWAEVLNLGGYDLLMKPFVREEVVRVAAMAAMSSKPGLESSVRAARKPPAEETGAPTAGARVAHASGGF